MAPETGTGAAGTPKIDLYKIAKGFDTPSGRREVVDEVSLSAQRGEFVSVIGPSGCGKSTLFNILAGLEQPDAGRLLVDGRVATGEREHFAYMPQKDLLFPWRSILENTSLGLEVSGVRKKEARQRADALFGTFGLEGFQHSRPFELSGGMRQRAALLRTVVLGREILLLDEPFGALDSLTRLEMQSWLSEVWQRYRWTVVMITHDVREAVYLSDSVVVLSARPTSVRLHRRIDLPRPRVPSIVTDPQFVALEDELLTVLHEESRRALDQQTRSAR